jgi:hypothetical protein
LLQRGATKQGLGLDDIWAVKVRLPPLNEQRRIVSKIEELFSDLDAGVAALERIRANLKRYRAAVLKAAVEGKLTEDWRAKHPKTEPATKLLERILAERRQKWEEDQLGDGPFLSELWSSDDMSWPKREEEGRGKDFAGLSRRTLQLASRSSAHFEHLKSKLSAPPLYNTKRHCRNMGRASAAEDHHGQQSRATVCL